MVVTRSQTNGTAYSTKTANDAAFKKKLRIANDAAFKKKPRIANNAAFKKMEKKLFNDKLDRLRCVFPYNTGVWRRWLKDPIVNDFALVIYFMPHMRQLQEKLKEMGFDVHGVGIKWKSLSGFQKAPFISLTLMNMFADAERWGFRYKKARLKNGIKTKLSKDDCLQNYSMQYIKKKYEEEDAFMAPSDYLKLKENWISMTKEEQAEEFEKCRKWFVALEAFYMEFLTNSEYDLFRSAHGFDMHLDFMKFKK